MNDMMTVEKALKWLVECDQQFIHPRPTEFGDVAMLLVTLAEHAEPSLRESSWLGNWRTVDVTPVQEKRVRPMFPRVCGECGKRPADGDDWLCVICRQGPF